MKKIYLLLVALLVAVSSSAADWTLRGDFNGWADLAFEETETAGVYTVNVDSFSGTFLVYNGSQKYGQNSSGYKMGMNSLYYVDKNKGDNAYIDGTLSNITITLDTNRSDGQVTLFATENTQGGGDEGEDPVEQGWFIQVNDGEKEAFTLNEETGKYEITFESLSGSFFIYDGNTAYGQNSSTYTLVANPTKYYVKTGSGMVAANVGGTMSNVTVAIEQKTNDGQVIISATENGEIGGGDEDDEMETVYVYFYNSDNWAGVKGYFWYVDKDKEEINDKWPGNPSDRTEEIDGVEYHVFEFSVTPENAQREFYAIFTDANNENNRKDYEPAGQGFTFGTKFNAPAGPVVTPQTTDAWYLLGMPDAMDGENWLVLDSYKFTQSETDKEVFSMHLDTFTCPQHGFVVAYAPEGEIDWDHALKTNGEFMLLGETYNASYGMGENIMFRSTYKDVTLTINPTAKTVLMQGTEDLAEVTILFENTNNWEHVYLYVWNMVDDEAHERLGEFPGEELLQTTVINGKTYYYRNYTPEPSENRKIIFSNGPNPFEDMGSIEAGAAANVEAGNQTPDLDLRRNTLYFHNGDFVDISELRPQVPEHLYIIGSILEHGVYGLESPLEMDKNVNADNVFSLDGIWFDKYGTEELAHLQFTSYHPAVDGVMAYSARATEPDWTSLNSGDRVVAYEQGSHVKNAGVMVRNASELDGEHNYFTVEPGKYLVTVDYNTFVPTVTLSESTLTGVEGIEAADEDAAAEYYNLQGVRVMNPEAGLYICRKGNTATKVYIK